MSNNKKVSKSRLKQQKIQKKKVAKKRFRIKYKKILLFVFIVALLALVLRLIYLMPIQNIIIKGNYYLSDQEIIDIAGIRDYPSAMANSSYSLEKKINDNDFIESVKVSKRNMFTKVIIEVDENKPLFYYQPANKTVLEDGTMVDADYNIPIVINQVPDTVYEELIDDMRGIPLSVLNKISEIKYVPTDVDPELFLITMNDEIYVYVTLAKFERIYNYIEYAEGFNNKKGILHLDSGDYLEVLEEE